MCFEAKSQGIKLHIHRRQGTEVGVAPIVATRFETAFVSELWDARADILVNAIRFLMCHAVPSDPLFEYRPEESSLWMADEVGSGNRALRRPASRPPPLRSIIPSVCRKKPGCFSLKNGSIPSDISARRRFR